MPVFGVLAGFRMSSPNEVEPYILRYIEKNNKVLDVGVGFGKNGYMIRVFNNPCYFVGSDIFRPYLKIVKYHRVYDDVVLHDAAVLPFKSDAFDACLASEVIEHLDKKAGVNFLNEIERVARKRVIIITPNKAEIREGALTPVGFNPWEAHKSSWAVCDFTRRGYKVYGIGFRFHHRFGKLGFFLNRLFTIFTSRLIPSMANELIAIKDLTK
jgi:ubiquinone/menaquinone biosynthesis C-methylase UbiE